MKDYLKEIWDVLAICVLSGALVVVLTALCLADEPEIVDYGVGFDGHTINIKNTDVHATGYFMDINGHNGEFYSIDGMFLTEKPFKISCPDGYELATNFTSRGKHKYWVITDAELKCVKETK